MSLWISEPGSLVGKFFANRSRQLNPGVVFEAILGYSKPEVPPHILVEIDGGLNQYEALTFLDLPNLGDRPTAELASPGFLASFYLCLITP